MPTPLYLVVSNSSAIDHAFGKASVFDIFDDFQAAAFPALVPALHALLVLQRDPGEENRQFRVTSRVLVNGTVVDQHTFEFVMNAPVHRLRRIVRAVLLPDQGQIEVQFLIGETPLAVRRLPTTLVPPPAGQAQ